MRLIDELTPKCEDFLEMIENTEANQDLTEAIESLQELLGDLSDGFICQSNQEIAYSVQNRLEEIYALISAQEKDEDPILGDTYDDLLCELEEISGYGAEYSVHLDKDEEDPC